MLPFKSLWQTVAKFVRAPKFGKMTVSKAKQRARWRRNKAAERRRIKDEKQPIPIDPIFEQSVWIERDKRLRSFPWEMPRQPDGSPYKRRMYGETQALVCDVWAVELILENQTVGKKISTGQIASWLQQNGKTHGVKASSLRTKVWRAREVVSHLENAPARKGTGQYWPAFPNSVTEHRSGLMQSVDDTFSILEREGLFEPNPLKNPTSES